ncbi:MAG: restriction endonuclease subunit S [Clostridium sp.]
MMGKPKIRFKGYNEDWEQRKLGEIADKAVDNRGKTPFISKEGTHPLLEVASLGSGAPDYSKVTKYLSDETFKTELRAYIKEGDILFSTVGSIGLVSFMDTNENAAIAQNIVAFRANESYDSKFLYAMLSTEENQYKAQRIVMGAVQPSIKVSQLVDVEYFVTENIAEQRKLGEYFLNLDHLITLHQHKCDEMKKLKKYMLQKMFPQNGKKVPEIRFDGFTNDWEQRKLGKLGSLKNGMNFSKDAMGHGFPFVNLQNIFGSNVVNVNELGLADATKKQLLEYSLLEGDVLFVRSSVKLEGVGEAALVPENLENTTYSGFIIRFRDEYGLNNDFKKYIFGTKKVRNQIMAQATNSANKNISQGVLENLTVEVPSFDEQAKIGEYFSNLDHLITLHQHKCDELQNLKKYMLQNMFV